LEQFDIPSPEKFFGFRMGSDYKLARWDKIVEYFNLLNRNSNRIKVSKLGKSTMGNPFIVAIISSSENLNRLDELKEISNKLADPRVLSEQEIEKLIEEGKSVVAMTMSLHASEVGGCQMASELAYELITSDTTQSKKIREETVFNMREPDYHGFTTNILVMIMLAMDLCSHKLKAVYSRSSSSAIGMLNPILITIIQASMELDSTFRPIVIRSI